MRTMCCGQVVEKEQNLPLFGCCTADSQTDAGGHQVVQQRLACSFFHCLAVVLICARD